MEGVKVVRVWTFLAPNKGIFKRILNYVSYQKAAVIAALFVPRSDIMIATSPQFFCGLAGAISSLFRRGKFILEIRDIWPDSIATVDAISNKMILRILSIFERFMYYTANHIVAVGQGYKEELLARGVPAEKISVIPNGVDADFFAPQQKENRFRSVRNLQNKFICSYIGTIGMAHGLEVVLRAAKKLQAAGDTRTIFLLVGDGARKSELERQVQEQGLFNVMFTGLLPKQEMPEALAAADCCLVHLRDTALFRKVLPSKIFEMLSMEKPILMGVLGEAAQLVTEAQGGSVFKPEDDDALLQALKELQSNPDLAATRAQAGRRYVQKNYDRERLAQQFLELLKQQAAL